MDVARPSQKQVNGFSEPPRAAPGAELLSSRLLGWSREMIWKEAAKYMGSLAEVGRWFKDLW